MKVLLCDDRYDRCRAVSRLISNAAVSELEVISLAGDDFLEQLKLLFARVNRCIKKPETYKPGPNLLFDGADVVALDNNLAELKIEGARITAESIAGYVRAFCDCGYVISLNKNPDVDFDLRFLMGDFTTRADLALNAQHLANKGLWTGDPSDSSDSFKPWYWPALLRVSERRRAQIDFVRRHISKPLLGSLKFSELAINQISPHGRGSLSPRTEPDGDRHSAIEELTFLDVFKDGDRSVYIRDDRTRLAKAVKVPGIQDIICRAVASDIDRWFRRDIVGPQEVLVDIPHLLQRFPMLLGANARRIKEWNRAATAGDPPYNLDAKLYKTYLAKAAFGHDEWLATPCFDWHVLKETAALNELFLTSDKDDLIDARFCEDNSQFAPGDSEIQEFAAEFEGSWRYRYVKKRPRKKYRPQSRFAR